MPVLKNIRHEKFAQGVAKGKAQVQAYIEAGYQDTEAAVYNASRLISHDKVIARVRELQNKAADKTVLTIERATNDLLRLAQKGEADATPSGLQAARASIMDACKLNGLVIDKSDVTTGGSRIGALSDADKADIAKRVVAQKDDY